MALSCDILRTTKYGLSKYCIRQAGTAITKRARCSVRQYTTILRLGSVVARIMPYPKVGMSLHTDCRQKPLLPRVRPNFLSCFSGSCGPLQAAIQLSLEHVFQCTLCTYIRVHNAKQRQLSTTTIVHLLGAARLLSDRMSPPGPYSPTLLTQSI